MKRINILHARVAFYSVLVAGSAKIYLDIRSAYQIIFRPELRWVDSPLILAADQKLHALMNILCAEGAAFAVFYVMGLAWLTQVSHQTAKNPARHA